MPGNRLAIQPRGCSGLEAAKLKASGFELLRKSPSRWFAMAAGRKTLLAEMNETIQKCSSGQDCGGAVENAAIFADDTRDAILVDDKPQTVVVGLAIAACIASL
jgi:hypothetical protein